jgi:hypothetical protein
MKIDHQWRIEPQFLHIVMAGFSPMLLTEGMSFALIAGPRMATA